MITVPQGLCEDYTRVFTLGHLASAAIHQLAHLTGADSFAAARRLVASSGLSGSASDTRLKPCKSIPDLAMKSRATSLSPRASSSGVPFATTLPSMTKTAW